MSDYRRESGPEAACKGAAEVAIRKRRVSAALDRGDHDAVIHERVVLGYASSDVQHARRHLVPVEPEPEPATPAPIAPAPRRRDRRLSGRRRARPRRIASRSAGDPDLPSDDGEPALATTTTTRRAA